MDEVTEQASVGLFLISNQYFGKRWPLHELRNFYRRQRNNDLVRLVPIFYTNDAFKGKQEWLAGQAALELFEAIKTFNGIEKFDGDFDSNLSRKAADMASEAVISIDLTRAHINWVQRVPKISKDAKSIKHLFVSNVDVLKLATMPEDKSWISSADVMRSVTKFKDDSRCENLWSVSRRLDRTALFGITPADRLFTDVEVESAKRFLTFLRLEFGHQAPGDEVPSKNDLMPYAHNEEQHGGPKVDGPGGPAMHPTTAAGYGAHTKNLKRVPGIYWVINGTSQESLCTSLTLLARQLGIGSLDTLRVTHTHKSVRKLIVRRMMNVLRCWTSPWVLHIRDCNIDLMELDEVLGPPDTPMAATCAIVATSPIPLQYFEATYHWKIISY